MGKEIDNYLQFIRLEKNLSPHTVVAYRCDLEQWEQFLTGGKEALDVKSVTTGDIRAWMLHLHKQGDSARTMRRKVQAVRSFYKWLMKQGMASDSPAAAVELARIPKRLPQLVRTSSMDELLDQEIDETDFVQVRNRLIVMMLYETGMRRAELLDLLDRNVDTASGELKVHGKRDKDRIIPFGTELAQAIDSYRLLRDELVRGCEHFFVKEDGNPLYPMLVYRIVHRALQEVGVTSKRSPHVLRHSFATAMLNDGAAINSVKELLGHESLATTQIYTHVTFSELKNNYKLAHPRALNKGG
ncbi:MAG: tyrosine-type recombinase/integrase [Muribaculaceae bacterium]|nr:tyrosine-type recombinase/integrase [Muribaculaceae bacterium]